MEWADIAIAAAIPTAAYLVKEFFGTKATKIDVEQIKRQVQEMIDAAEERILEADDEHDRQLLRPIEEEIERLRESHRLMHAENREDLKDIKKDVLHLIALVGKGYNFP